MTQDRASKITIHEYALGMNSPIVHKVHDLMAQAWGFKTAVKSNPAAVPVTLEKTHLSLFESNVSGYMVSEKSEGERYQLVLGTIDGRGFSVMVNRKMQMFEVSLYANSKYFKGSVFDGEVVLEKVGSASQERQVYLVFDVISCKGETRLNEPFIERYNEYTKIFDLNGKDLLHSEISKWDQFAFETAEQNDNSI